MASYLGKISALVTANTAPFRAALGESAKDLNRWRSDVNRTLNAAADGNWDRKILTKMQQVRQAIAAAQVGDKLNFRLDESQIRRIEQMYSAIEQIAKPLEKARNQFEGLSTSVQAKFLPALEAVQREALLMRDAIEAGAKIGQVEFDKLDQKVKNVAASMKMLEDIGGLRGRLVTGDELRFRAPGVSAALSGAAELQARSQRAFGPGDTRNLSLFQLQAELAARLEENRSRMLSKADRGLSADKEIRREQNLLATLQRINQILEKRVTLREQINEQSREGASTKLPEGFFRSRITLLPKDYFQKRQDDEVKAIIARERKGKETERRLLEARDASDKSDIDALIARERAGKENETALARASKAAEDEDIRRLIEREKRGKALEDAISGRAKGSRRTNTGDISRGGTDKFSLGIQQAAFAVEDFFSVTGGLDQRIRAAGNNISQLGFILGSTTGLFAGIGVTIAAQAIAPLLKLTQVGRDLNDWLESGRNKADSFRDSIAAQKQAVDDLSASFGRLAASIDNASTSSFGRQAKDSRAQIVSIAEGLRNVRERQLFSSDAGVLTADARVKAAENRLGRATTVEEARTARQELEAATQEQRAARERAVVRARQPVDVAAVRRRAEADIEAARVRAEEFRRATLAEGGDAVSAQMGAEEIINEAKQRAAAQIAAAENAAVFQARQRGVDRTTARLGGLLVGGNRVAELAQGMAGQVGPGEITRRLDEVGRIREELARTIDQVVKDGFDPAVFEQVLINANKMQLALLGAASAMQEFIGISDRIKQTVSADVGSLEQRAEQARRAAVIGIPGAAAEAVAAGDTAAEARRLRQRADDAVDIARRRIEQGVLAGDFTRLGQIETALQAQGISVDERERLMAERRAIRDRVAATMEGDPNLAAARGLQADATRMAEFAAAADRGRELAMTPGQRAARDLRQQLGDVNAFFGQRAEDGGGLVDVAARNEAMQRVFRDAAEQVAPMFAQFRDEVMTARLQGPSRAALNMVDVATMEGQRELNRLLRGDDPARDVNLAELQKQTTALEELVTIARDMNVNVAD